MQIIDYGDFVQHGVVAAQEFELQVAILVQEVIYFEHGARLGAETYAF